MKSQCSKKMKWGNERLELLKAQGNCFSTDLSFIVSFFLIKLLWERRESRDKGLVYNVSGKDFLVGL